MAKERKFEGVWDAKRILYNYISYSDKDGCLPVIETLEDSSYKIRLQRFYAALDAYGKSSECFYKRGRLWRFNPNKSRYLLGETRSKEKMIEFCELLKKYLKHDWEHVYLEHIDNPTFLDDIGDIAFVKLIEYRKKLYAIENVWSGMMECSRSVGTIYEVTRNLIHEHISPLCQIIDRMIILLMGDDYDKSFTERELFAFGYPDVTDDELFQMDLDLF